MLLYLKNVTSQKLSHSGNSGNFFAVFSIIRKNQHERPAIDFWSIKGIDIRTLTLKLLARN